MSWSVEHVATLVGGQLQGRGDVQVDSMEALDRAGPRQLTFVAHPRQAPQWFRCRAAAALVPRDLELEAGAGRALIRVEDVDLAMVPVLELMAPPASRPAAGVHPSSVVAGSARLGEGVCVGPHSLVGERTRIGAGTVIHPGVTILEECRIGAGCVLWPGVVVRERCELGDGCVIHPNATIGADGFGFRPRPDGRGIVKVPQIGTVRIGASVEIGAGTCIDRGKFSATEVGAHTKIDNLVQIGHNCRIGTAVIIAGCCGIGGSTTIGDGVVLGGGVRVRDHLVIGAGATIAAAAAIMHDVPAGETWAGYPAKPARISIQEHAAIRRLPELLRWMKRAARPTSESPSPETGSPGN